MSELSEAIDKMNRAIADASKAKISPKVRTVLVTISDAISAIAAVLPAPNTVPIEPDTPKETL